MPNGVKYSTTTPSGSLRRGNVALGVTSNLGPSATTGFYSMPAPQSGKYIINKVSPSGIPNFFAPANDAELIRLARTEGAVGADTGSAAAVLAWMATQDNLEAVNIEYENIVTDGLVFNTDAGFVGSYPTTGTTWYDLSGNNYNGTLTNGPTYTSSNGGGIVFDGVDDYAIISNASDLINTTTSGTVDFFYKLNSVPDSNYEDVWGIRNSSSGRIFWYENNEITNPSPIMRLVWRNSDDSLNAISSQIPYDSLLVYNITFTYVVSGGSTTIVLYKNGSLVQSFTVNKVLASPSNEIRLGTDSTQYSNCTIFTYRVYNRALSSTEILQNYNAQKGRFGL